MNRMSLDTNKLSGPGGCCCRAAPTLFCVPGVRQEHFLQCSWRAAGTLFSVPGVRAAHYQNEPRSRAAHSEIARSTHIGK